MSNIPTAKEFYRQTTGCVMNHGDIKKAMIEFARLHVEAALKAADKDAQIELGHCYSCGGATTLESQNTILNAYPLDNIK